MKTDQSQADYENAGYNRFFRRTLASNPTETSLKNVGANRSFKPQDLNFDERQTSGALGDVLRVGPQIEINGPEVAIKVKDTEANDVIRLGDMEI